MAVDTLAPEVGQTAPDFTLMDTYKQPVSLSDFAGQTVVLVFFPAAFSGVCTSELCTFRDAIQRLNEARAQVLGISVDLPYSLRVFKEQENLNFPLLSDFDRITISDYGIVDTNFNGYRTGVARRSVLVLDGNRAVRWRWIADNPGQQPDYTEVLQAAAAAGSVE